MEKVRIKLGYGKFYAKFLLLYIVLQLFETGCTILFKKKIKLSNTATFSKRGIFNPIKK